jgi:hypothetical protein
MSMASIRKRTQWRLVLEDAWHYITYSTRKQAEADNDAYCAQGLMGLRVEATPGGSWEVRIRCKHAPDLVKTFRRRDEAKAWAKEREGGSQSANSLIAVRPIATPWATCSPDSNVSD